MGLSSTSAKMTPTFSLTPKQVEVRDLFKGSGKYFLVYGGSRSGKTFAICYAILVRALKAPGSRHVIFRRHGVAVKQAIGKDTLPKVAALAFGGLPMKWHEQDGYFRLPNGSEIWLAGLDDKERVDKVLGREFATLYFNEASEIPLASYQVATTRLAQVCTDARGKALPLKCYVDLNPTTAAHWTYQLWVMGVNPDGNRPVAQHSDLYRHITVNPLDNAANLSDDYIRDLEAMPERLRKRFYAGVYTSDDDSALWRRSYIKVDDPPEMGRVVVSIDPATTNEAGSDETGIIVAGIGKDGRGWVLADESGKYRPEEWARRAISLFDTYDADAIVAEVNQGGDMVASMIRAAAQGRTVPVSKVTATRSKHIRAEPVAALYEQGKARHAQEFPQLCDQLCSFTIGFDRKAQGYSPDRVDALVWAFTSLFPGLVKKPEPPKVVVIPTVSHWR